MIRNIIWDVDGTLFDTYPGITQAFLSALSEVGISGSERQVSELAQVSLSTCGKTLTRQYGLELEPFMQRFSALYKQTPPEDEPPFPGVEAVCAAAVAAGGVNVIATHRGRWGLDRLLDAHGLRRWFAGIRTADDHFPRKPDPAMFNDLIAAHSLRPDETLALGDRDLDIQAGMAAGARTGFYGEWTGAGRPDWAGTDYAGLVRWMQAG